METASRDKGLYRTLWRWHFYAGLLAIPLVAWLSVTGSIYLFKTEINAWIERDYDTLPPSTSPASAKRQVESAMTSAPGMTFISYELPQTSHAAARVILGQGSERRRIYVDPGTAQVLGSVNEDERLMQRLFYLHGELMMGTWGSTLVELAASWAIVLLLTGLFLWWPRSGAGPAGVLYPRLGQGGRLFWRDLHAVTGVWVSAFALFLILTGLPWAKNWGAYLQSVRQLTGTTAASRKWTSGRAEELTSRAERTAAIAASAEAEAEHTNHLHAAWAPPPAGTVSLVSLDKMTVAVASLKLAPPVLISPPSSRGGPWQARSDSPNRTLQTQIDLDPNTAEIIVRDDYAQWHWIDRTVGFGISAHEGQLFGIANKMLGLFATTGLVTLAVSAAMMWWRRRPPGLLGAPVRIGKPGWNWRLVLPAALLAVYLPLLGLSMIVVFALERAVLSRVAFTRSWLGLG